MTGIHTMNQKLRAEARAKGQIKYEGTPCKHGHTLRYTAGTGSCVECRTIGRDYYQPVTRGELRLFIEDLKVALRSCAPKHPLLDKDPRWRRSRQNGP
jgi:hypothetical protein